MSSGGGHTKTWVQRFVGSVAVDMLHRVARSGRLMGSGRVTCLDIGCTSYPGHGAGSALQPLLQAVADERFPRRSNP